jgi:hypothetical protein
MKFVKLGMFAVALACFATACNNTNEDGTSEDAMPPAEEVIIPETTHDVTDTTATPIMDSPAPETTTATPEGN